jgi:orotidine-5'-phosphate decarboxylase
VDFAQFLLCVGLDPDLQKFPAELQGKPDAIFEFCRAIIDATAEAACAFKPQIAYFAALGAEEQLERICAYLRTNYPEIPLVLDAKRGDIGATAEQYAREAFERYDADVVTVSPYMGWDSVSPGMEGSRRDRAVPHLQCRRFRPAIPGSRWQAAVPARGAPGGREVEYQRPVRPGGRYLPARAGPGARHHRRHAAAGAGRGSQGGDVEATVKAGKTASGTGMMINSSRAILYAKPEAGEDFAAAARRVAIETRDAINRFR